ncbi:MAG: rod shape-determining protein RodA [Candidatus Omnitrophica bacterium]|nr:rod shape-determining protein RodA [Candidatus Omnitrophota bacterium]
MIRFRFLRELDVVLLSATFALFAIGLLFIYSASFQKDAPYIIKQLTWMGISAIVFILLISIPYTRLVGTAYVWYGLTFFLLLLVLFLAEVRMGAQRWLKFGGFNIQPSEFAKVALILTLACCITRQRDSLNNWRSLILPLLLTSLPMMVIVLQPDLGTALILIPVLFSILYAAGYRMKYLNFLLLSGVICAPLVWHYGLKPYQKERLLVFINPNLDPAGAGYTIIQSKIAIGSGMLWGKGWLHGTQSQLKFLPESHTDFIFAVVGEEWGFLGALLVVFLYAVIAWRGYRIAQITSEFSGRLLATGLTTMLACQAVVNIGMTLGLLPVVGVPLPLLSYGGSSLFITMISLALLENVRLRRM